MNERLDCTAEVVEGSNSFASFRVKVNGDQTYQYSAPTVLAIILSNVTELLEKGYHSFDPENTTISVCQSLSFSDPIDSRDLGFESNPFSLLDSTNTLSQASASYVRRRCHRIAVRFLQPFQ